MTRNHDIGSLFDRFLSEQRFTGKRSEVTLRGYVSSFTLLLKIFPDLKLDMLSRELMTSFFRSLETRERRVGRGMKRTGIKATTVATYRSKLNQFFSYLQREKKIRANPFKGMSYPRVVYGDRKYLQKDEVKKIFSVLHFAKWENLLVKKRNIAMFEVLLNCGLRKGELLGLELFDIDFEKRLLRVRSETSKSRRERSLFLNNRSFLALQDYKQERDNHQLKTPALFVSNTHDGHFSEHGMKHLIARLVTESGVSFHLHRFRHTFAANLYINGTDIAKLQQLLGHQSIQMTAAYLRGLPPRAMRGDLESISIDNLL